MTENQPQDQDGIVLDVQNSRLGFTPGERPDQQQEDPEDGESST